jgi:tight adherence protein C
MIRDAVLLGAVTGIGLTGVAYGLRPRRQTLAQALIAVRRPPLPPSSPRAVRYRILASPLARLGLPSRRIREDLAMLDRDTSAFLAEQAAATILGVITVPLLAYGWGLGGTAPLWLGLLGGALGYRWAQARTRARAARRREELRHTLSAMLDLVTISLAGGAGVEQALDDASSICAGWAADRLRGALRTARLTRTRPWIAFGQLGEQAAVPELVELATAMGLAGTEGARIRRSLAARAAGMRAHATADMESAARSAAVRMSLPVMLLALGYGMFLLYPALAAIREGL